MDWTKFAAIAAAIGVVVAVVKNITTIGGWVMAPIRGVRQILGLRHKNARLIAENERIVAENGRLSADVMRVNAENDRLVSQNARLIAENAQLIQDNAALKAAHTALEAKLAEITKGLDDRGRWEDHTTARGGVVLRRKGANDPSRPAVYACINCFRAGRETILQPDEYGMWLTCKEHGEVASDKPDRTSENVQTVLDHLEARGRPRW